VFLFIRTLEMLYRKSSAGKRSRAGAEVVTEDFKPLTRQKGRSETLYWTA